MKARLAELGATVLPGSPADFGKLIAAETDKWRKVIRAANIGRIDFVASAQRSDRCRGRNQHRLDAASPVTFFESSVRRAKLLRFTGRRAR
jgi:hypothetical protein